MRTSKLVVAAGAIAIAIFSVIGTGRADDGHRNKWPWPPSTTAQITTLPFQGVHGCQSGGECAAAYDLVVSNNVVVAGPEGSVTFLVNTFPPGQCNSIPGGGYGNFVEAGGLRYGHLDLLAPSVTVGATLLQGDQVGTQGSTGHVDPSRAVYICIGNFFRAPFHPR
jgi:murein DD-endopeptidase MepM/ murein hydrolase activator NlpD